MVNQRNIRANNGITLIALIVTIIVLLILSGVTITAVLDNEGLVAKSQNMSNDANTMINQKTEELNNMIDELDEIMNPWEQDKTVITKTLKKEMITLNVGDTYDYDCGVLGYTGEWKVLGVENGKLLIMSTIDIGTLGLSGISGDGTTTYPAGYNDGIEELNQMCMQYGTNARSIKVEDINRITGYDPKKQAEQTVFGAGEIYEYGNKVTYTAGGSISTNGSTYTSAISEYEHPDGRSLGENNITAITVGSTYYYYYPNTLTTSSSGPTAGIETTSSAYEMLFRNSNNSINCSYWLASSYIHNNNGYSTFGIRGINTAGNVYNYGLYSSNAQPDSNATMGVRAVVIID